jgi:hypothetical protein
VVRRITRKVGEFLHEPQARRRVVECQVHERLVAPRAQYPLGDFLAPELAVVIVAAPTLPGRWRIVFAQLIWSSST